MAACWKHASGATITAGHRQGRIDKLLPWISPVKLTLRGPQPPLAHL